jgi:catechol 2,3-dioxygenase-like lactoylglutathione lyase family enzyme
MSIDGHANVQYANAPVATVLKGVHHTARPTWKLKETVHFYRDVLELKLCHAICARGWGPEEHPDFIHFFFESGQGSTIAFFYYLQTDKPADNVPQGSFVYNSVHTAWRVDTQEELEAWKEKLESKGYDVMRVPHEILDSIYVTDPNGYAVEIVWQTRDMNEYDEADAKFTLEAAITIEDERGDRVQAIDEIWQRKARLVGAYLAQID